ncbi:MAG TPA: hypothetical protein PLU43_01280, partial [Lachnospiraceae bacterium]|nr:hypothetical protein [Lachnospiraceae bacterium]
MKEIEKIIRQHSKQYPKMQPQDVAKLIYQNEFGAGHFVDNAADSLQRLQDEYGRERSNTKEPVIERIGNGYVRYALSGVKENELETLNRLFVLTAGQTGSKKGRKENYEEKLYSVLSFFSCSEFSFTKEEYRAYIKTQKEKGYPAVSHSEIYRQAYTPVYRVIDERFSPYVELLAELEEQYQKKCGGENCLTVGIDGNAAAGKTTLAWCISELYDCEVIHMDDFFLPPHLRTGERLSEPGGNIHYERFLQEVVAGIKSKKDFSYRIFSCHKMDYTGERTVKRQKMIVVEGAYSMRPEFRDIYDYKIFIRLPLETQLQRIQIRNGPQMCRIFEEQ